MRDMRNALCDAYNDPGSMDEMMSEKAKEQPAEK
jgi:hypothetical protein